jgi:hypothetical protein
MQKLKNGTSIVVICTNIFSLASLYSILATKFIYLYKITRKYKWFRKIIGVKVIVFNSFFNNISVILWQSVLLVEDIGENHQPVKGYYDYYLQGGGGGGRRGVMDFGGTQPARSGASPPKGGG